MSGQASSLPCLRASDLTQHVGIRLSKPNSKFAPSLFPARLPVRKTCLSLKQQLEHLSFNVTIVTAPLQSALSLSSQWRSSFRGLSSAVEASRTQATQGNKAAREPRVYRCQSDERMHRFQWGVGSRFRSQSQNRFRPVHKPFPKTVLVAKNYFQTTHSSRIQWEALNEAWEVYWYEHQKLNAKPFPVKKYGVEGAKEEAMAFLATLKSEGRLSEEKPCYFSAVNGVKWDEKLACWVGMRVVRGRPETRSFSSEMHGFEAAKILAERYVKSDWDRCDGRRDVESCRR